MHFRPLTRAFFARPPAIVAKDLIGKILVRNIDGTIRAGMIVETEAYLAEGDAAAHGFKGKTVRNESLYKAAGHAYVHQMRQHFLLDVVTEKEGVPSSVLIRALESVRGFTAPANGPGKLCAALSITRVLDGVDMTKKESQIYIAEGGNKILPKDISFSTRIGISRAADMPLRFYLTQSRHVSKKR